MHRPLLFEGLPGSGKTTCSRDVAHYLESHGRPSRWALEEARDHPWFGAASRASHREPGFVGRAVDAWHDVVADLDTASWALDGVAWQSTVRFLFEQDAPTAEIERYWRLFEAVVTPYRPVLVHLRHPDARSFIRDHTIEVRSDVWDKIATHVRSTPVGQHLVEEADEPHVEFWVRYHALCDHLAALTTIPVVGIDLAAGWPDGPGHIVDLIDRV